eukprot:g10317.t1
MSVRAPSPARAIKGVGRACQKTLFAEGIWSARLVAPTVKKGHWNENKGRHGRYKEVRGKINLQLDREPDRLKLMEDADQGYSKNPKIVVYALQAGLEYYEEATVEIIDKMFKGLTAAVIKTDAPKAAAFIKNRYGIADSRELPMKVIWIYRVYEYCSSA